MRLVSVIHVLAALVLATAAVPLEKKAPTNLLPNVRPDTREAPQADVFETVDITSTAVRSAEYRSPMAHRVPLAPWRRTESGGGGSGDGLWMRSSMKKDNEIKITYCTKGMDIAGTFLHPGYWYCNSTASRYWGGPPFP
ncbi:hypothetical protein FB45DRAFT_48209 [Roridomyces roridus]|uniref:Uncharacterized protein n=1 Tax=Roridomyces roridus TaxID=1738132 RepID=A0AAD7BSP0_9AGAR|nr:hypothetical protein FB45DRAFT_48209 [Roridomyces roridus]